MVGERDGRFKELRNWAPASAGEQTFADGYG
jgi:hypothetical protein